MKTTENTVSEYEQRALDFLEKFGIKFRATLSDTKPAPWSPNAHGHHYRVTLSKPGKRVTFDFWDSLGRLEEGIDTVEACSVLSCCSADINCPEDFSDFCGEYGYDEDSIQALQAFRRCSAFANRLRAFFTETEMEALVTIN